MRKIITLLTILLFVVFMVGCENAINPIQSQTQNDSDGISVQKKGDKNVKVEMCHLTGNGKYVTIKVDESAVDAHLAHGDYISGEGIRGQWLLWFNANTVAHYIDFDNNVGGYPSTGFERWEEITSNVVSCNDITVSFDFVYIEPTPPPRLDRTYYLIGELEGEYNMSGTYTASNGGNGVWTAINVSW